MIAVDSSVIVAAFAPWHESHDVAHQLVDASTYGIAHCALESYSTLTRLPDPFRAPPDVVVAFLEQRFADRWLHPTATTMATLTSKLASLDITGGATYDALVAVTAMDHGSRLCSLDHRAERTYRLLGAEHELLARS